MLTSAKDTARWIAEKAGARIIRLRNDPSRSLCGIIAKPIRTVIDVGANYGMSAERFLLAFPEAKLISFEPQSEPFARLEHLAAREPQRMRAIRVALGNDCGEVDMLRHVEHDTSSSFLTTTDTAHDIYPFTINQERIRVPMRRLDEVIETQRDFVADDILIKLDVQGFEMQVIAGGGKTMCRAKAVIAEVSLLPLYEGQPTFPEMIMSMAEHGLRFAGCIEQFLEDNGQVAFVDAAFVRD